MRFMGERLCTTCREADTFVEVQLAAVTVIHDEAEVEAFRGLLRAKGIDSWCRRTDIAAGAWTGWACTGGSVEVLVRKQDADAARGLLPDAQLSRD
jgi:hypothetical protein